MVGEVPAIELVTVGQRKGLGLGGLTEPRYVVAVDVPARTVTIGSARDLLVAEQPVTDLRWAGPEIAGDVRVQCSAHGRAASATVAGAVVRWREPQRRVAPGQSIVLYDTADEVVVGGANFLRMKVHLLAWAAAVLVMTPCAAPLCIVGLPFGMWLLSLLSRIPREAWQV